MTSQTDTGASRAFYTTPELKPHGSLEGETHGMSSGAKTDAYFPLGTPHSHVTFS